MKKMVRRTLALALSFAMVFTMSSASVFAEGGLLSVFGTEDDAAINLLVLGDSTSSGYGLPDFVNNNRGFDVRNNDLEGAWTAAAAAEAGKARISNDSYPWQLKKYIEEKEGMKCNLSSMCLNGMRTDELRAFLSSDYYKKINKLEIEKTKFSEHDIGYLTDITGSYVDSFRDGGATLKDGTPVTNLETAQAYTRQEIENADVIVLDICNNNFGSYFGNRIVGHLGIPGYEYASKYGEITINDIDDVPPEVKAVINKVKKRLEESGLMGDNPEQVEFFVDTFLYTYADTMTNFTYDVAKIRKINPDAQIITVGLYNPFEGMNLIVDGKKIDFGRIAGYATGLFNTFIQTNPTRPEYYYADVSGNVDTFIEELGAAGTPAEVDPDLMNLYHKSFYDTIDKFAGQPVSHILFPEDQFGEKIDSMLVEAAGHTDIDIEQVAADIGAGTDALIIKLLADLGSYFEPEEGKQPEMSETTWVVVHVIDRFVLDNGVGQHPSKKGCEQKFQAVKKAYNNYCPRYESIKTITKDVLALPAMIRNARTRADFAKIRAKIAEIKAAIRELRKKDMYAVRLAVLDRLLGKYEADLDKEEANLPGGSTDTGAPSAGTPSGQTGSDDPAVTDPQAPSGTADKPKEETRPAAPSETVSAAVPALRGVKAKAARKGFTVRWKRLAKKQRGSVGVIQVQYGTDSSFSAASTRNVSAGKSSLRVKRLSKGSVYYVRTRTVQKGNANNVSAWSGVKRVKVK